MTFRLSSFARIALVCGALLIPGVAAASSDDTPVDDTVRSAIVTALEAQGYQVFTIETERGGYEVKAAREGRLWELRLNADLEVTRTELED